MSHEVTRQVSGATSRERLLAEAFVGVADSLTEDFDVAEFLQSLAVRCVELLGVSVAGVLLADPEDELQLVAASGEHAWVLDLFALQREQGPCLDCYRSGVAHVNIALNGLEATTTWPRFATCARDAGYAMTQVLPLRQGDQTLGTLNLFQAKPQVMGPDEIALAQALADVATIAILQRRSLEQSEVERGQLQEALTSRIDIEQAKGVLAERWKCTVDEAFGALRRHARANRLRLAECARQVVAGELDTEGIRRG
ncbi:GAF and ANTAR domain-containing protein [Streptomyces sp. NBC_01283]|uniref:ANTAR domain-containing protein n=1 Tax=Streptomyces sp. NBC_01283 TaxID=2903812 RepID=UPI00352CA13D|nr:GAF and ANTAR domain-containing protein [Streptomyces sp. NBC_01283]